MRADFGLWIIYGIITSIAYAFAVCAVNSHKNIGRYARRLVWLEVMIGQLLAGGLICGLTGQWWLWRVVGLAYLIMGLPLVVGLLITKLVLQERDNEYTKHHED